MLDELYVVARSAEPVTAADLDLVAATLGLTWPVGYGDLITEVGEGTISGWVRVYPPGRVLADHVPTRERWTQYYFWGDPASALTREQVAECVPIGDTLDGDELIVHPRVPGLFLLPRNLDRVIDVGDDLDRAVGWLCSSGVLTSPIGMLWFEPWTDRGLTRYVPAGQVRFKDVVVQVAGLGLHDRVFASDDGDAQVRELFVPSVGGSVTVVRDGDDLMALVGYSTVTADPAVLSVLARALVACGLVASD